MKCEVSVGWHNGNDDMELTRKRQPEEVWGPTPSPRNIMQAISVLDDTFADARAALLAMLPNSAKETVSVVQFLSAEEARATMRGDA